MKLRKAVLPMAIALLLASCVAPGSFIATSYEPVMVKKKGDLQAEAGTRLHSAYSQLGITYAPSGIWAARLSYGGRRGISNVSASAIFFKNYKTFGFFAAPMLSYQQNIRSGAMSEFVAASARMYAYNCRYLSPGLALGIKAGPYQQLILKVQYNLVNHYSYYYREDNSSDGSASFWVWDNESLNGKIPAFFSFEPTYALIFPWDYVSVRLQAGFNLCQASYLHRYSYSTESYQPDIATRSTSHPVTVLFNIGVGISFNRNLAHWKNAE